MLRVGVIGAGPIAERHLDVLSAIPAVTIQAICSRRPKRLAALGDRFSIPDRYDSHDALLAGHIDAVLVLVAPDAMCGVARTCLERGVPAFLEKPPALTARDARELARVAAARRVPNMVGLNRRFYSVIGAARAAVQASGDWFGFRLEAPEDLRRPVAAGRGEAVLSRWIMVNSIHAIDLCRYLLGTVGARHALRRSVPGAHFSVAAIFEGEQRTLGEYVAHWGSAGRWALTFYGRDLQVHLSPLEEGIVIDRSGTQYALPIDEVDRRFKPGFFRQMEAFVSLCASGERRAPAADLDEAAASLELAEWLAGAHG